MDGLNWRPQLTLMSTENMERLHDASTAILEKTGLNVHHEELRELLADHGARLGEPPRVYLPREMVEKALSSAKRNVIIHDRLGEAAMPLGPHDIYFGTGSDLLFTRDAESAERRSSVLEDVARSARLCDALDEIDFVMSFSLPSDVPNENAEPEQYYALLKNTTKPVIMTSFSGQEACERMHEMACAVAGGDGAFRERPNYVLYGQFVSPLQHDRQALERLIFCADHEIPLIYVPTIMPGVSGPITLSGSLALASAESLAGLVMHQMRKPGAPFIFGACVGPMDMRTMRFPYGGPEWRLNDLVMAELSRHYRLPVFGTAGATDSKVVDAQSGAEYAASLLVAAMAGTNLIHDVGYMDGGLIGSLESIVLGAESIKWTKQFMAGLDVTDEALALDVIDEIGPAKHFLEHSHTLDRFREALVQPYVLDRDVFDTWQEEGAKDYAARARRFAAELIGTHRPEPVDDALDRTLKDFVPPGE